MVEWLTSPTGIEFTHAVILLITAVAAWISYRTHTKTDTLERKLNGHISRIEPTETPLKSEPKSAEVRFRRAS